MMGEPLNQFIDTGLDLYLAKSFGGKNGLVQIMVTVNGRHGTYQRRQWVKAGEAEELVRKEFSRAKTKDGTYVTPEFFPLESSGDSITTPLSVRQVIRAYQKSRSREPINQFLKSNYFISDGVSETRNCYRVHKEYTDTRKQLHRRIVEEILSTAEAPKDGKKPVCVLLGGGSASGKSTIRSTFIDPELKDSGIKAALVDSDDIKSSIPEYKHFQKQEVSGAAFRVHHESSDIADMAIEALITAKKPFVYDGTMKTLGKYDKLIDKLKDAGYEVRVVAADLPLDLAIKRSAVRAEKTGREVPKSIIESSHGGCALTFPKIAAKADEFQLYDNTGKYPELVQDNHKVYHQDLYDAFIEKGKRYQKQKEEEAKKEAEKGGKSHA